MRVKNLLLIALFPLAAFASAKATTTEDSLKAEIQKQKDQLSKLTTDTESLTSDVAALKKLKVTGYLQLRYEYNDTSKTGVTGGYNTTKNLNANNFYIRRGRIKFAFQPGKSSKYVIYFDASKNSVSLKEAFVDLYKDINGHKFTFTAGQINIPFGYEIEYSSSKRDFPERSAAENVLFKGERDRGINLTYEAPKYFQFNIGLLQGYGIDNTTFPWYSPTKLKHVVARAKAKLGDLDLGISAYHGTTYFPGTAAVAGTSTWYDSNHNGAVDPGEVTTTDPVAATPSATHDKNRLGMDAQLFLNFLPLGGTGIRAEYYGARDKATPENGWYLWLSQSIYKKFAGAIRYDFWDPNTKAAGDALGTLSLAAHYFWDSNVRITAAYDIPRPLKGMSMFAAKSGYTRQNRFTLQFQFSI